MISKKKEAIPQEQSPTEGKKFKPFQPKFEVFGEEMIEKVVKQSGNSGRVYLPPEWVGKQVKIIRIN